jgi:hypothetical protein
LNHALDVEIPLSKDVRDSEMILRGALIGEAMTGTITFAQAQKLVSSLSLSSAGLEDSDVRWFAFSAVWIGHDGCRNPSFPRECL